MARIQTIQEERWNVITHGFGFILALIGALWMLFDLPSIHQKYLVLSILIYLFSQLFLYFCSAFYHYESVESNKVRWRKMDHIAIYISIAGTYTPICLLVLIDSDGWKIFYTVWGITFFGVIWKMFFTGKFEVFSSLLYLIMGWLIVLDIDTLRVAFTDSMMFWLIVGGAFFTIGIIFYAWNKLAFNHVIWHFFVLGGSVSHYIMVKEVVG
ncbi:MAG: hemolysin III family protein [Bacteroidota bacterium]